MIATRRLGSLRRERRARWRGVPISLLGVALLLGVGCDRREWWYPFPVAIWPSIYGAGPLPITSNIREDDPALWQAMPALNTMLGRLGYAMTRGEPDAQIAWLYAHGEWPDAADLPFFGIAPNRNEGTLSRALSRAGYVYDRISRSNLAQATLDGARLRVGHAHYDALLLDDWRAVEPAALARLVEFAEAGLPIVAVGALPERAYGWREHAGRDARVKALVAALGPRIRRIDGAEAVGQSLRSAGIGPALETSDGAPLSVRIDRRRLADGYLILLFNESASDVTVPLRIRLPSRSALLLDPESGRIEPLETEPKLARISIPARRIRLLRLRNRAGRNRSEGACSGNCEAPWNDRQWRDPGPSFRPIVRWWWPGNAVREAELLRELRSIAAQGFGGVELQTLTLGFSFDALEHDSRGLYGVGSAAYLDRVRAVMREAKRLGLQVDLTLGSGWPSGGPFMREHTEQQLVFGTMDIQGPVALDAALPRAAEPGYVWLTNHIVPRTIGRFDDALRLRAVVAARLDASSAPPTLSSPLDLTSLVTSDRLRWRAPAGHWRVFAAYQNATRHNVAGAAYPHALAGAPVLDHLDPGGLREYIEKLGEPWLRALRPETPAALFVDSFELIGELPWSDRFRQRFLEMHSYDLLPDLPFVLRKGGESKYALMAGPPKAAYRGTDPRGQRVREDYLDTREQLFLESFVAPLHAWTRSKGVALRLQAHGGYADVLDAYQQADIPESEGLYAGGRFDFLKLASSAAHVTGRRVVSAESFVALALVRDHLAIEDYYLLAGNALASGINRIVAHGYAYHLPLRASAERTATKGTPRAESVSRDERPSAEKRLGVERSDAGLR